ncbi:hypothetical protein BS78_K267300 [Paspalum vaginatum]|uniref:Uncharacterized protein n=1 Tax=Paspalum vaginatum TaxID=158149 RepID=A0A9W8CF16_9POAL|nr:hypothetical protein BS78_K267300 [Paspalum vaginatum]
MTGSASGDRRLGEHYSRLIRELCALLFTIVSLSALAPMQRRQHAPEMSPVAVASMLLGASVALMLCGSVTFAIGVWVASLALLFSSGAAAGAGREGGEG